MSKPNAAAIQGPFHDIMVNLPVLFAAISAAAVAYVLVSYDPFKAAAIILFCCILGLVVIVGTFSKKASTLFSFFLIMLSMVTFLEFQFRGTKYSDIVLGIFTVSPSILLSFLVFLFTLRTLVSLNIPKENVVKWIFFFSFFLFISSVLSIDPARSLNDWLLEGFVFPLFFFTAYSSSRTFNDVRTIYRSIIAFIFLRIAFIYAVLLFSGSVPDLLSLYNYTSYASRAIDHLSVLSILSLYGYFFVLADSALFPAVKILLLIMFSLVLISVQDRAALLSFAAVNLTAFIFMFQKKIKPQHLIYVITICFLLYVLSDIVLSRFRLLDVSSETNILMRYDSWRAALAMFLDHPLFGIGLGLWDRYIPAYSAMVFYQFIVYPHHFLLHYLSAGGIFVFICLAAIYIKIFLKGLINQSILNNEQLFSFNNGLFLAILSFFIYGFLGGNHSAFTFITGDGAGSITGRAIYAGMLFWASAGMIFSLQNGERAQ